MSQDQNRRSELLHLQGEPVGERSRFCPEDEAVGGYYAGTLDSNQNDRVTRHLADCRYCRGRLGMLARLEQDNIDDEIPDEYKALAKQLAQRQPRRRWKTAPAWAAAATLFLAVGIWIGQDQAPFSSVDDTELRQLRSVDTGALEPTILHPAQNARVDPSSLEVRWTAVSGSLHYEIYVMSDTGELLLHERTDSTRWTSPTPLPLDPEGEYYVRVEAHLADATTVSTGHILFTVSGEK